jgi:CubicO group peptidase (beta-lactamase class C family)
MASDIVQGKATLNDPAAKYLVAAGGARVSPNAAFARITLRNLVTHTASLPDQEPNAPPERDGFDLYRDQPIPASVMTYLNAWTPPYPPGTRYSYSNLGFVLMAYAATSLAQMPYREFLAQTVTRPLGMTRTAPGLCDMPDPLCAAGQNDKGPVKRLPVGLWTTASDMLLLVEANLGALKLPDLQTHAIALTHHEEFRENSNHAVGMAWEEHDSGDALLLAKDGEGAGFTAWIGLEPARARGVAVLSNIATKPLPASLGHELLMLAAER